MNVNRKNLDFEFCEEFLRDLHNLMLRVNVFYGPEILLWDDRREKLAAVSARKAL